MDNEQREDMELSGGGKMTVRTDTRYTTMRRVQITAPNPDYPDGAPIEVVVDASLTSDRPEPGTPTIQLRSYSSLTRRQWELFRRIGDQAWDEYEKRFGAK